MEYLNALPSLWDVLAYAPAGNTPVVFTDADEAIEGGRAYVFRPINEKSDFERISVVDMIR